MNAEPLPLVFVGSSAESMHIAKAVQNNLADMAHVKLWTQGTFKPTHSYLEDLLLESHSADFAIFILSPDDITKSRKTEEASPRDNIIFEAGLFMGSLGRDRVFLLTPQGLNLKKPTDLLGITMLLYSAPQSDREWRAAIGSPTNQIEEVIEAIGRKSPRSHPNLSAIIVDPFYSKSYATLCEAASDIKAACKAAVDIKVLAITGVSIIGRDDSVISTAELESYTNMKKLRILLMSAGSRWLTSGLASQRQKVSVEDMIEEMRTAQKLVEIGIKKMIRQLPNIKSGIRYFTGEPCWRLIMTDKTAFVSNYADDNQRMQSRDLPVYRFENIPGSFYIAFKRRFNDIWHNESKVDNQPDSRPELTMSAGGIVYFETKIQIEEDTDPGYLILLLRRSDGNWVLPKGHKIHDDNTLDKTAIREVEEESGIPAKYLHIEQHIGSYADNSFQQEEQKEVFIYSIKCTCEILPKLKPDADHSEARWQTLLEAKNLLANPDQKALLDRFAQSKRQQYNQ